MATWTLADIRTKVRSLTGAPSTDQLSDAVLDNYINNYYQFSMPFELKEQITLQFLDFKVYPGISVYAFPGNFLTDQPMAYADGMPLIFYQDPDVFYQDWPQQYAVDNVGTGTGAQTNFPGGLQNPPIIRESLFITDGSQVAQDDGLGQFTGDVVAPPSGSINYDTGAFNVTFLAAPSASTTVYAKYQGYSPDRPQGVLFFNNEFTFMPIPDQVYQIRMQGYINPTQLTSTSDTPLQQEWGQLIAYGASLDIFSDRGDLVSYQEYYPLLKRYENVALARTVQQYQAEQTIPRF